METSNTIIDSILYNRRVPLGKHYDKYRNHVYRVFNFCLLLDEDRTNKEKYAIASAFHDLGIWTDHTFDYLAPSVQLSKEYLLKIGKREWQQEIYLMIDMHHKRSVYRESYSKTVETFRKADWIDVTQGRKAFGSYKTSMKAIQRQFPNEGFHFYLIRQTLKNFLRNPLNPLPMFKK